MTDRQPLVPRPWCQKCATQCPLILHIKCATKSRLPSDTPPCAFSLFSTPIWHPPPPVSGGWFFCQKKKVASHHMLTQPRWFVWKVKVEKSKTELLHVLVEANMRNRFRFSKPWKYEFLVKIDTRQKNENGEQIFFTKLIHWIFIFNIGWGFGVLNGLVRSTPIVKKNGGTSFCHLLTS